jgi:hypothetical protein
VLERAGSTPEECLYTGDRDERDGECARRLGSPIYSRSRRPAPVCPERCTASATCFPGSLSRRSSLGRRRPSMPTARPLRGAALKPTRSAPSLPLARHRARGRERGSDGGTPGQTPVSWMAQCVHRAAPSESYVLYSGKPVFLILGVQSRCCCCGRITGSLSRRAAVTHASAALASFGKAGHPRRSRVLPPRQRRLNHQ